ncbi:Protein of unknown function [Sphingomonas gellani]|uniref:DUF4232 domain-containing protein n=1 Tax=Sphingomonas gellani TaxID=1166340 RepID=A0A1H7YY43_9SPHN|nr:DUF4232 domain-containing protein [Sphingomonas gellani]SEM50109.1 Protein of unknown function [Sphingomonas gellani]
MLLLLAAAASAAVPTCPARALTVATDARDGDFNGMSHSGTYLVIRNIGRRTCSVPGLPVVTFRRGAKALPAKRRPPVGMHPGPVIVPVRLAPGGQVATGLRWVSGPVYDRSRCWDATRVGVTIADRTLFAPASAHLCGPVGGAVAFDQPPLTPFR